MKNNKQNIALIAFSIYSIVLLLIRIKTTNSFFYLFLVWNLFLAYIPYLISLYITRKINYKKTSIQFWSLFGVWLLFLPNAPYIITDFVHLQQGNAMPYWFDLLLISAFSFNGLLLFFISVDDMHKKIQQQFSKLKAWILTTAIFFLCGFGIYLGRFLRFNSWDIIHKPQVLFKDVFIRFTHPIHYPKTWGITLGFGMLFSILFIIFNAITVNETSSNKI